MYRLLFIPSLKGSGSSTLGGTHNYPKLTGVLLGVYHGWIKIFPPLLQALLHYSRPLHELALATARVRLTLTSDFQTQDGDFSRPRMMFIISMFTVRTEVVEATMQSAVMCEEFKEVKNYFLPTNVCSKPLCHSFVFFL